MSFKPMLAKDADPEKITFPVIIQPKLDGIRASVVDGRLVTRTLKEVPNREIFNALSRPEFEGLDGELIVGEPTADDCYRRTASFCMSESKTGEEWTYYVFDRWNVEGKWHDRCLPIATGEAPMPKNSEFVRSFDVYHADALAAQEAELVSQGYEGVILRTPDAPYKFGRSGKTGPLLKLKRFVDFEAEIIGVYEEMHNANEAKTNALGRTERSSHKAGKVGKGTLGGFYLRALNGPAEGVEFKCGTGFDAASRASLWAYYHRNDADKSGEPLSYEETHDPPLKGMVVKVKSFPIGVKDKPRHPVFLGFRDMSLDG